MPLPALYLCKEQAVIKMVKAKGLSLRGGRRPTWQSRSTMVVIGKPGEFESIPRIVPAVSPPGLSLFTALHIIENYGIFSVRILTEK